VYRIFLTRTATPDTQKQALTEIDAVISDAINFAVASGFPVLANYLRLAKSEVGYLRRTK
jgi:hypothetical protein